MTKTQANRLVKILGLKTITTDESMEAMDLMVEAEIALSGKEIVDPLPDSYPDDDVKPWTKTDLKNMPEATVVKIAIELGIDASTKDLKDDTIAAVLAAQAD